MNFNWDEDDFDDNLEDNYDDDLDGDDFECGFVPRDGCSMVGTQDCEFECPYRTRLISHPQFPYLEILENGIILPAESVNG
ncbi:MAG: hypothetical protein ACYT04_72400 [Nostoc sp.]